MKKRLEELRKDQKGFTLVELIVVLVILAILAALLVPALLGYIDRARNSKYLEEARSIYTAIQAANDEDYAAAKAPLRSGGGTDTIGGATAITFGAASSLTDDKKSVANLIEPTELSSAKILTKDKNAGGASAPYAKTDYQVTELELTFISQDGKTVTGIKMKSDGSWDTEAMKISE